MLRYFSISLALWIAAPGLVHGHAPPVYIPVPPFRVEANALIDAANNDFLLRGVQVSGLEVDQPTPADEEAIRRMTPLTFRVIRQRWNSNAVRLPIHAALWQQNRDGYRETVAKVVRAARAEQLAVILVAHDPNPNGLPRPSTIDFWIDCAAFFRSDPGIVFDLFERPSARAIGRTSRSQDWEVWRNGGLLASGEPVVGMQALADALRSTGATQLITVQAFDDALGFQSLEPANYIGGANVIYQAHPSFDTALSDEERQANFGFLRATFPLLAGEWGMPLHRDLPACRAIPTDPILATTLLFQTLAWFDARSVSWIAAEFRPGSLIQNYEDFEPTKLDAPLGCDPGPETSAGMGQTVLLWTTGDPGGFGSLVPDLIANAAGGPAGPISPGEIIAIYGQGIGPEEFVQAQLDAGRLPFTLAETQVFFDGIPAPVVLANSYQVYVQVPYEIAGRPSTAVQLFYRGVPSNRVSLPLVEASPQLYVRSGSEASALNQDGTTNTNSNPAERGSEVTVTATGWGLATPSIPTGTAPSAPYPAPALPISVTIAGKSATVREATAAPSQPGVLRIKVRIPQDIPAATASTRAETILTVGAASSRTGVSIWTR